MGFWDSVKSVALSAKCFTGWHEGEYKHIEGEPQCHLGKTCPDCGEQYVSTILTDGSDDDLEDFVWDSGFRDYLVEDEDED